MTTTARTEALQIAAVTGASPAKTEALIIAAEARAAAKAAQGTDEFPAADAAYQAAAAVLRDFGKAETADHFRFMAMIAR